MQIYHRCKLTMSIRVMPLRDGGIAAGGAVVGCGGGSGCRGAG